MARRHVRTSRNQAYAHRALVFLVLTAISLLALTSVTLVSGKAFTGNEDSICNQLWIQTFDKFTFGMICAADAGTEAGAQADPSKTIWNPLAKSWLTDEQVSLLKLAYDIGYQDGGMRHARLMQSTLLQETIAGQLGRVGHRTAPVGKRSYGVMQVKVTAAQDVLQDHVQLNTPSTVEELIVRLMTDDDFNIRVASKFLLYLREKTASDAAALTAYNLGLRGARRYEDYEEFGYVKSVNRYFESVVIPFNKKYLGHLDDVVAPI